MPTSAAGELLLTEEQAQEIVRKHLAVDGQIYVKTIKEIYNHGYSFTSYAKMYNLDLGLNSPGSRDSPCSCVVTISDPLSNSSEQESDWRRNPLAITHHILNHIRSHTDITIPPAVLDTSLSLPSVPYHYLLLHPSPIASEDVMSLAEARTRGLLNEKDDIVMGLQIGRFLGQLHSGVQNDWYGLISREEPRDPSYSWQETFTLFLETLLFKFEADGSEMVALPYEEIRRLLSRAIGFYLFDDVEVPSLVWFTGSATDIYVAVPPVASPSPLSESGSTTTTSTIVAILPNFAHALWGDPLLESIFMASRDDDGKASEALVEGYQAGGGGPIMAFPRQRTKRIWYTLFTALVVLKEHRGMDAIECSGHLGGVGARWAIRTISRCVEELRDAPCY